MYRYKDGHDQVTAHSSGGHGEGCGQSGNRFAGYGCRCAQVRVCTDFPGLQVQEIIPLRAKGCLWSLVASFFIRSVGPLGVFSSRKLENVLKILWTCAPVLYRSLCRVREEIQRKASHEVMWRAAANTFPD